MTWPLSQQIAMGALALLCILGGLLGAPLADVIAPLVRTFTGGALPAPGSRSDAVLAGRLRSGAQRLRRADHRLVRGHRLAGHAGGRPPLSERETRRGPAWDCGFPIPSPATQYTASSFAQPLRRVYGAVVFAARETVTMPPPGDTARRRASRSRSSISSGASSTPRPAAPSCGWRERLNMLQFLTIRRYLVLMFAALVILLFIAAVTT